MRGPLEWESYLELDHFRILETDNFVTAYYPQPDPIEFELDGKLRSYTADTLTIRRDGVRVHTEVKYEKEARKQENLQRFAEIREQCRNMGCAFHVAMETEIRREPRLSNAKALLRYRRVMPEGRLALDVMDAVATQRLVTVRDLMAAARLPMSRLGEVYALALCGDINIDLEAGPLSPDSRVFRPYNLAQGGLPND